MKRLALALLAVASLTAGAQTATQPNAYIYCNDGSFDAFSPALVDSITYSRIDIYGEEHQDYVTQLVWRDGRASQLPIQNIEKVDFTQPETVVSNNVFPLTAAHDVFLTETDLLSFTLSPSTPAEMRPVRGNVVVARADCRSFANGIVARVTSISENEQGYNYICEPADLNDVFDQIVLYDNGVTIFADPEGDVETPAGAPARIEAHKEFEIWNKEFSGTIANIEGSQYHATDKAVVELKIRKTLGTPLYANITLTNDFAGNVSYELHGEKEWKPAPVQIGKTLKVGRISFPHPVLANLIWLEPQISVFGYFEAQGKLDVDIAAHLNRQDIVSVTYSDKQWNIDHKPTMDAAIDAARLSLSGSVEAGLKPEIVLALNGSATGVGIEGKVGLKQTLDLTIDGLEIYNSGVYEALKDTQTDTYLTYATSVFVQSGLFDKDTPRKSYSVLDSEKRLFSKYMFPHIKNGASQHMGEGIHSIRFEAERDVILPLDLSVRIYDDEGNFVRSSAERVRYDKATPNYSFSFDDLDLSRGYTAYPTIHLGDLTMQASPAIAVNECPARVTGQTTVLAYYDSSTYYCNRMIYTIHAELDDTEGVTEWGLALDNTTLYPFSEVAATCSKTFDTGVPDNYSGTYYRLDYYNYVFEMDRSMSAYVKRVDQHGNEVTTFSPIVDLTMRYDNPPSLTFENASLARNELIGTPTSSGVMTFRSTAIYTMTLTGAFWIDYIDGGVNGTGFSMANNPEWRPTYDNTWETTWQCTYLTTDPINHSNWYRLHLRSGLITNSDYLNWIGGKSGTMASVSITPASGTPPTPGYPARRRNQIPTEVPTSTASFTIGAPIAPAPSLPADIIRLD